MHTPGESLRSKHRYETASAPRPIKRARRFEDLRHPSGDAAEVENASAWSAVLKDRCTRPVPPRGHHCLDRPAAYGLLRLRGKRAMSHLASTHDLLPSERRFVVAMT